ncbi:MAG: hypothetical protein Q8P92_05125 [Candidatus Daviesbacteria bacterium]|nr:hypothetical protein [Candidatus Daviesbacteria bacterium]
MKKIIIISIIIIVGIGLVVFGPLRNQAKQLVSPESSSNNQSEINSNPTPIPTPNAPKTFQFDSSTDLKQELEKVNPQVLDSDFE